MDVFLPFSWIAKHAPQDTWNALELHFSSPYCLENCTKYTVTEFSLSLDGFILTNLEVRIIGYMLAVETGTTRDPLELVLVDFKQFLDIMGKEAANSLLGHTSYDHVIVLKKGEKSPWEPIYPLLETELETL